MSSVVATRDSEVLETLPRGRHGLTREAVRDSQRRRILQGMIEVVAERGYGEARITDAIEAAGVSRKTFYELFGDKEDCFLAAYEEWTDRFLEATVAAFDEQADAPWTERITAALAAFLAALAEHPAAARVCIVEVLAAGPKALARRDAALRRFAELIDQGRSESALALPGMTGVALAGGIYELLHSELLHGAARSVPGRLPDVVYWVVQPYLGEDEAAGARERARSLVQPGA